MKDLVNKIISLEREMSKEKGSFSLFALFLREDTVGKWDILVSAHWLELDKKRNMEYITKKLYSYLNQDELLLISRIVLLEKNNPILNAIHKAIHVEHSSMEVHDSVFLSIRIKHAYVITSLEQDSIDKEK